MTSTAPEIGGLVRHERVGRIHLVVLTRSEKRNALTMTMVENLLQALAIAGSESAGAIVILGEGPSFCAGADIGLLRADLSTAEEFYARYGDLLLAVRTHPSVVVAGIQGYAVGGGAEIAMEADFRVMSRNGIIGYPDVAIGSTPATVQRLVRIVGDAHARRMVLLGEQVSADEARHLGIALQVVDGDSEVRAAALAVAERAASLPALSVRLTKEALELAPASEFREELLFNAHSMARCQTTDDQRERAEEFLRRHEEGAGA